MLPRNPLEGREMQTKQRTHTFQITVTFDRACTASHALREVADTIHGEFYPTQRTDDEPGTYRVKNFCRIKKSPARQMSGDDNEFMGHPL